MKVELREHEGCFEVFLEPEDMKDAALLVRFGLNATKEVRSVDTTANRDGSFHSYIVIGKCRNASGSVR